MEEGTLSSRKTRAWRHQEAARTEWIARKQIKQDRKPDRVRHREWLRVDLTDDDALDALQGREPVMPRGERKLRQTPLAVPDQAAGDDEPAEATHAPADETWAHGVVVQVASGLCRVDLDGRSLLCSLRGTLSACETGYTNVVAVGDEVGVSEDGAEQGVVEEVLPRRSVLARPDPFYRHLRQVVVANVDQLLVGASRRSGSSSWTAT